MYVFDGTRTSLPLGSFKHSRLIIRASSPDATPMQYLVPINEANSSSKDFTC